MASNIKTGLHIHKHSQQRIEVWGENMPWRTGGHCFLVVLVVCLFAVNPIFPLARQAALLWGWRPPTYVTQPWTAANNVSGIRIAAAQSYNYNGFPSKLYPSGVKDYLWLRLITWTGRGFEWKNFGYSRIFRRLYIHTTPSLLAVDSTELNLGIVASW